MFDFADDQKKGVVTKTFYQAVMSFAHPVLVDPDRKKEYDQLYDRIKALFDLASGEEIINHQQFNYKNCDQIHSTAWVSDPMALNFLVKSCGAMIIQHDFIIDQETGEILKPGRV